MYIMSTWRQINGFLNINDTTDNGLIAASDDEESDIEKECRERLCSLKEVGAIQLDKSGVQLLTTEEFTIYNNTHCSMSDERLSLHTIPGYQAILETEADPPHPPSAWRIICLGGYPPR